MTLFYGHKPRLLLNFDNSTLNNSIHITTPEVSQAFYAILNNNKAYYTINSENPFRMYIDISIIEKLSVQQEKNFTINVYQLINKICQLVKSTDINEFKPFYEEYGGDFYYRSIVIDEMFPMGTYLIEILNPYFNQKYVFAVGNLEEFTFGDSINAIKSIIQIKTNFFNKNILSVFEGKIMKRLLFFVILIILILLILYIILKKLKR
ncbi:hypothetical protein QJ857_gp1205 [Tupanvirus soda lake]|uniref:Uncharacterized protein n=2 Tax=Tupanvirus TaxID=2094720 RepID=A0A6N1NKR7_9VIRU|nr:hypothetical protein QJ857_gp1205 [Tupanvirus soda lake]QKU34850.1 hypothetical protein [Tupanvirus soda lake]